VTSFSRTKLDDLVLNMWSKARQPSAGIAVVSQGEIIYSQVLDSDRVSVLVDNDNSARFHIASISKSFNSTLIAMLVDEGRLDWDRPVVEYAPDFRMIDAEVTRRCTLRDMVCMRTGLPRHDMAWVGRHCTRGDLFSGMQFLQLSGSFRTRFEYNNLTATMAGHIAERVTGEAWEQLVRDRIFIPLGMTHSACDPSRATVRPFHEGPSGTLVPSSMVFTSVTAPSGGSIVSALPDMAKWASFNLSQGVCNQTRLLSASAIQELHRPQIGIGVVFDRFTASGCYGLGWFVDHYNGYRRISHAGYVHDINSDLTLFPDLNLAVINYCAFGSNAVAPYISQEVFDAIMGLENRAGIDHALLEYSERVRTLASERPTQKGDSTDPISKAELEGLFAHPGYGSIQVVLTANGVSLRLNDELEGEFIRSDGNVWTVAEQKISMKWPDPFRWPCQIEFCGEAHKSAAAGSLKVRLEPEVGAIEFVRQH
jgi:CubicO group peptidase (beta-lactamase class C family)